MQLINGIGGVFIFSRHPGVLAAWYAKHLGIRFEESPDNRVWYQLFYALDPRRPERKLDSTFSIIGTRTDFSRPVPISEPKSMYGDQPYMINLRTDNLDHLLRHLKDMDTPVLDQVDEPYGRFAWVRDADGNRVELYQPVATDRKG